MRIVGREQELELVRRFLTAAGSAACALHLHGEAGIGKSTIWQQTLAEAAERGFRVVSSRPTEAEARMPFAGLNDLIGELLDGIQPDLPRPQRVALDAALLRATGDGMHAEPLAISLAVVGVLRAAAIRSPLLLAIDDVPWLDESSTIVLEFALRRLDLEPIGLVVSERTQPPTPEIPRLVAAFDNGRVYDLPVTPLTPEQTDRLLAATLDLDVPPSLLARIHRVSGGNPFYSVEIGRALQRHGASVDSGELPIPDTLAALVRDRLSALSTSAKAVVVHAAALSQPTVTLLDALVGSETATLGLADAVMARVLARDGALVRFTHPLLSAEAYAALPEDERRDLHSRLAAVVTEPEEHATHLALAVDGPREDVAQGLEAAAERAHARGAPDAAADLAQRAVALTPEEGEARQRRRKGAAHYRMLAGDLGRANEWLDAALRAEGPGHGRADILMRMGEVRELIGDWPAADELFEEALVAVDDDVRLTIEIKLLLGGVSHITGRNWETGARHVSEAMALAEELGDPRVLAGTIGHYATWQYITGGESSADLERRAAELDPWTSHLRTMEHPDFDFSFIKSAEGDARGFYALHERLLERAERMGDYSSLTFLLANLAAADWAEGRSELAADRVQRAERLARATGQRTALAHVLMIRTILHAQAGEADKAWECGQAALTMIAETGWLMGEPEVREQLGLLELSRRNPAGADEVMRQTIGEELRSRSSPKRWVSPTRAEALIALGKIDEARELLDEVDRDPPIRWAPDAGPARALLHAAEGDMESATDVIEAALARHLARGGLWNRARTLMIAGEIHRRARRRAKAREALLEAAAIFDRIGARLWARRAREHVEGLGGSGRDDARGLTPTQNQVAELVKDGLTNRQIAGRLFMSIHTVEAHVSAIYRKLGIASRRELPRALADASAATGDSQPETRDSGSARELQT